MVACLATEPFEALSLDALQDGRVVLRLQFLLSLLSDKTAWVENLCLETWGNFAYYIDGGDLTGHELRDTTLRALHRGRGYLHLHGISQFQRLPLSLCQGDISSNLTELEQLPEATLDRTSRKIRRCLDLLLYPRGYIIRCLLLAREFVCTTDLVEKPHGAGSNTRNLHKQMGPVMISQRAFLASCLPFFTESAYDIEVEALQKRISEIEATPIFYTARNEHCRRMMEAALGMVRKDDPAKRRLQDEVFCTSADEYRRLSPDAKNVLEIAASRERARRLEIKRVTLRAAENALAKLQNQGPEQKPLQDNDDALPSKGIVNSLSRLTFTDEALQRVSESFDMYAKRPRQVVQADTDRQLLFPEEPPEDLQDMIDEKCETLAEATSPSAWWQRIVATHRDRFYGTALVPAGGHAAMPDVIYAIAIAMGGPGDPVSVLELHKCTCLPALESLAGEHIPCDIGCESYRHNERYIKAMDVPTLSDEGATFGVVHICWTGGAVAVVYSQVVEFDFFLAPFVSVQQGASSSSRRRRTPTDAVLESLMAEFPWLTREDLLGYITNPQQKRRRQRRARAVEGTGTWSSTDSDSDEVERHEVEDAAAMAVRAAEDVFQELAQERERYAGLEGGDTYFYLHLPGGLWTERHKGKANDCAACLARAWTHNFCERYGFQKKYSFMYSAYPPGKDKAVALARAWVHKGNYFYQRWEDASEGDLSYSFTQDDLDMYVESQDFLDFVHGLDIEDPAFDRVLQVRRWVPRS